MKQYRIKVTIHELIDGKIGTEMCCGVSTVDDWATAANYVESMPYEAQA